MEHQLIMPGGYFIKCCMLGLFHQFYECFMCMYWFDCIVLVNCYSKKVSIWGTSDFDYTLENGQKSLQKVRETWFNFS